MHWYVCFSLYQHAFALCTLSSVSVLGLYCVESLSWQCLIHGGAIAARISTRNHSSNIFLKKNGVLVINALCMLYLEKSISDRILCRCGPRDEKISTSNLNQPWKPRFKISWWLFMHNVSVFSVSFTLYLDTLQCFLLSTITTKSSLGSNMQYVITVLF